MLHQLREQAKGAKLKFLQCMSPEMAVNVRSLQRRNTSAVEAKPDSPAAASKGRK
jgi:hypothetical protein